MATEKVWVSSALVVSLSKHRYLLPMNEFDRMHSYVEFENS